MVSIIPFNPLVKLKDLSFSIKAVLGGQISRLLFFMNMSKTYFRPLTINESLKLFVLSAKASYLNISWGLTRSFSYPCYANRSKLSEINLCTQSPFQAMYPSQKRYFSGDRKLLKAGFMRVIFEKMSLNKNKKSIVLCLIVPLTFIKEVCPFPRIPLVIKQR